MSRHPYKPIILFFMSLLAFTDAVQGQICGATNSYGCSIMWFSAVTIKNSAGTTATYTGLNCTNSGNATNFKMTNGAVMDVTPGEKLTISLENTCTYQLHGGIWLDLDGDNSYTPAECLSGPTGAFTNIAVNSTRTATIQVPCGTNIKSGVRILRIRCGYYGYTWTAGQGCGTTSNYGNILDFEVNLKAVSPPVANFTVPTGPNYVKTPIQFNSTQNSAAYTQQWTFYNGATVVGTGPKGKGSWANVGNYDVKLKQSFCGYSDSITKNVKIVKPTAAPVANFIASSNQVEIYIDNVTLNDLSTNGAYIWDWEVTSPSGIVYNYSNQTPNLVLDEIGKWDVCLTSTNDIGPSSKVCKTKYIECTPPSEFYLGPNKLGTNQGGTLYDNGGPTLNYSNNRKVTIDYFKILPCGAKEIRFRFKSLKLADASDKLKIYDGYDEGGKLLTPAEGINGSNQNNFRSMVFKAYSGAMYITFESNGSGTDSGIIAVWDSDLLPPSKPKSGLTWEFNPSAIGMTVTFTSAVQQAQGNVDYEWQVDGNPNMGSKSTFDYIFTTQGQYDVCLVAATCNGNDTACKPITIVTPSTAGLLAFSADVLRPKVGDVVKVTTQTDYASNFEWSIFPSTFSYVGGTNQYSKNPQLVFNSGGAYTFTLKAWNSVAGQTATEKKIIKSKYVIAITYCSPTADLLSADVGINRVELSVGSNVLIDNETVSGVDQYSDYSGDIQPTINFGTTYKLRVSRRTNSNPVNFKVWIDYNIDGDFDDANELVLNSGQISTFDEIVNITVPSLDQAYEGSTIMRVAASYGTFSNSACGVNIVGEFEDYGLILANDNLAPDITLLGNDTVRVEKGSSATSCYKEVAYTSYVGSDPSQGDLTPNVTLTSDLDCTIPGIYYIDFNLKDAAGNSAQTKRRTVIVVLDNTAPVLTLNGGSPMTVEQCDVFTDPGAIAYDAVDGNLTSTIKVKGSVDAGTVGSYQLEYSVIDAQGNKATKIRVVEVKDTKNPGIYSHGSRITDNATVNVQINSLFVDDIYGDDACNGSVPVTKVAGYNGVVNTLIRATYPVRYYAQDPSGNKADEDGYTINYKVDDFIAPEISLNTGDTVIHDVNHTYSSQQITVFDNYYPLSKISISRTGSVDPFKLGLYSEKYTATDESGNSASRTRYVKVVDREAPQIVTSAVNVCVGTPFWAMSDVVVTDNYYSSDVLMPLVKVVSHNVNIWRAGLYYINYQVIDPSGNKSEVVMRPINVAYPPDCENTFTGTGTFDLNKALEVYPNPTGGQLTISYALNNDKPLEAEIFNTVGTKVGGQQITGGGFGNATMDLSSYSNGTYMIRFTNNGATTTKRVVVSK